MSQLSGGVSVDHGYRVRYASDSRSAEPAGRDRDGTGFGPAWGEAEWNLPGQGESGPGCGEWYPDSVCETCGEPRMVTRSCGRRSCPDCWGMWAKEAGVRATVRIQAFRYTQPEDWHRQAAHAVVSPQEGEVMNERQYWEGKKKAAEIAKEKGWRGFAVIPHPWRVTEEGKEKWRTEVDRDSEGEPVYGVWVWLRNDYEGELEELVRWSPHYHIIGMTGADMEPAEDSDDWAYSFIRSFDRFEGVRDHDSHQEVYGTFRYLLSHTGFPKGCTRQATTWHGALANNKFVSKATESWQHQKPSEGVLSALEREVQEVAGPTETDDRDDSKGVTDDKGACPVEGCGGVLIDVFDVGTYLRQTDPPPEVAERMKIARDWRLGRVIPPPGMQNPQTKEQASEAFTELVGD